METVNNSEEFVLDVCRNSFLSLWCYANPIKVAGKELCDILIVCDPHVVAISVKETLLNPTKDPKIAHDRWQKKAVTASKKQLYTAARWLKTATHVIRKDGSRGFELPPQVRRRIHMIAVAFGSRDETIIRSGDEGKGYVHVMTETSFYDVLRELDTVTDMADYLRAKEDRPAKGAIIIEGGESELLAYYLLHNRTFPNGEDVLVINGNLWTSLNERPEYKRRKIEDKISYAWDSFIEFLSDTKPLISDSADLKLSELEIVLRTMNKERRFYRRILGSKLTEFLGLISKTRSRLLISDSGATYVLVHFKAEEAPDFRIAELGNRCFVARFLMERNGRSGPVIGLGLTSFEPGKGSAQDVIYLDIPEWTEEDSRMAAQMQTQTGYYQAPIQHHHEDEYSIK